MAAAVAAAAVAVAPAPAHAENELGVSGAMAGPVFGISWGKGVKAHGLVGIEAGFGLHPLLRGNAGLTWRNDEVFAYMEADGWFAVGGTVGIGYGTRSEWQGVVGVWEAVPLMNEGGCHDAEVAVLSGGYRWTGVHELYIAGKWGRADTYCWSH